MTGRILYLAPVGPPFPDPPLLDWLAAELSRRLGLAPVADEPLVAGPYLVPDAPGRLCSNQVVDALIRRRSAPDGSAPADWTLGVTAADLFAPGRPGVFGEAAQGGAWALVSLARLLPPESPDPHATLRERLLKEAIHELGHVAGLPHCDQPRCVMSMAVEPEDVDRKGAELCPRCASLCKALV